LIYAADGSINVTLVDGSVYTGLYAADGTWNVIEAVGFGLYHPCGAYRVTTVDGSTFTGIQAADGSWNVTNADSDGETGFQHPCGAIRMSGLFSPLSLAPFLWLDPSDLSTLFQDSTMLTPVTASDDPVGAMLDKSGNGHHVVQATAGARPLYKTSGGLHWLEFDGVDDTLGANVSAVTPYDCIGAFRLISEVGPTAENMLMGSGGDFFLLVADTTFGVAQGTTQGSLLFGATSLGADFVATQHYDVADDSRGAIDNGDYTVGAQGSGPFEIAGLELGQRNSLHFSNMRFYGLAFFDRALADPEIAQLRTYLASKQGRVL